MTVAQRIVTEAGGGHLMACEEGLDIGEQRVHADSHKCVATHRQGVLQPHYPEISSMCDTTHMSQPKDELQRVREALREAMARKGFRNKPLAIKAGLGDTSVRDLLDNEDRDIKLGTLLKIAGAMDLDIGELIGSGRTVPLVGRVGAGGNILYEEVAGLDAPRPAGLGGEVEALEVEGSSMLPRYSSGDIVYIEKDIRGVREEHVGEFCAVRLVSGETYLKQLAHGSKPGFFTLRSLNAEDIVDVELEWATPIILVLPRAARRLMGF